MKKPRLSTLKPRIEAGRTYVVQSKVERLSGSAWQTIKKRYEREHPRLCAECNRQNLVGNGDELDHIIPVWAGGTNHEHNLQWLCKEHHKQKTAKEAAIRVNALHIA